MEPSTLFNILITILLIKFVLDTVLKHLNAKHFNDKTKRRQEIAKKYNDMLISRECSLPDLEDGHMVAQYSICVENRLEFTNYLSIHKIPYKIFYEKGMHEHDCFSKYKNTDLPVCDYTTKHIVSIPCYDSMDSSEIDYIIGKINDFFNKT